MPVCPLCRFELEQAPQEIFEIDGWRFACSNCGCFELDFKSNTNLPSIEDKGRQRLQLLSHVVRKMNTRERCPRLPWKLIESILANTELPSPVNQVENLLLWLADNTSFGQLFQLAPQTHLAVIGATGSEGLVASSKALMERGLASGTIVSGGGFSGVLTLAGWEAIEALRRGQSDSHKAFMAMEYGDPDLDKVFAECFRPAARAAGFELQRLDDAPPAGLIDDRLRVEIRTSRFLIADLTHDNRGAYWEAGFAEGLGRPVIYTCERSYFKEHGTHFDTSHHHTITWDSGDVDAASVALKTTIRATLPSEAILEDSE